MGSRESGSEGSALDKLSPKAIDRRKVPGVSEETWYVMFLLEVSCR